MSRRLIHLATFDDEQGEWTVLLGVDSTQRSGSRFALVFLLGPPEASMRRHVAMVDSALLQTLTSASPGRVEEALRRLLAEREASRVSFDD